MKCTIKPLADRVLVKPAEAEQKTAGGIIIPDTAKENAVAKVNSMKEKLENYDPKQIEKLKIEVSDLENSLKEKTYIKKLI